MASAIDKDPKARSGVGYSDFPMTQHIATSMSVGEMLPGFLDILQPGDKVKLSYNLTARLNYLERPAFETIEICQDYFFVPLQQLYKPFEQVFYGISDFNSDFYDQGSAAYNNRFPFITLRKICDLLVQDVNLSLFDNVSKEYGPLLSTDSVGKIRQIKRHALFRLLDACQFPMRKLCDVFDKYNAGQIDEYFGLHKSASLWFLLAYQKIWFDHFRDTDRISNDPQAYNFDSWFYGRRTVQSAVNNEVSLAAFVKAAQAHLCPWDEDYFQHNDVAPLLPTVEVSSASDFSLLRGVDLGKVNSWLGENVFQSGGVDNYGQIEATPDRVINPTNVFAIEDGTFDEGVSKYMFNTANMRAAFAVEKLLEVTRRSKKHYDKQTLAHFGVDVPTGTAGECFWISHKKQPVAIGDIVATATTGSSEDSSFLGELGGRGYSNTDAFNIDTRGEFEAKTHGVLMSIIYIRPKITYQQVGVNRLNKLTERTDFPIPELGNLGKQPLFGYESNLSITRDSSSEIFQNDRIRGWKYRYAEFKEKYPITRGALLGTLADWSASTIFDGDAASPQFYYVHPDYLNPVLSVQFYGGEEGLNVANYDIDFDASGSEIYAQIYSQDPFVLEIDYNYLKLSKMSKFGLPKLEG